MYKQKSKTSCLLDAAAFATNQSSQEVINQFIIRGIEKKKLFSKHRYFKYVPTLQTLRWKGICPFIKSSGTNDDNFSQLVDENVDMILGVNLHDTDDFRPLHAVYYRDGKAWEPYEQKFIGGLKDLNIVYAIICYNLNNWQSGINKNNYLPESVMWLWDTGYSPKKKVPENYKMQYLKIKD